MFPSMKARLVLLFVIGAFAVSFPTSAQQSQSTVAPGPNVNMVSGTGWPGGDPFVQRQNETAGASSSRNALHLLSVANDYRSVDIPGILGVEENGDAWIGVFTSLNGGQSWTSTLLPGCPYSIPQCAGAPTIQGMQAAADPIVRTGVNGLFHISGIAFSRGTNAPSAVFVATYIDNNNKENGNPIKFVSLKAVDTGTSGQFLDKPGLAADIPRAGATVVSIPQDAGGGSFPVGNVYFAYSRFVGSDVNNPHSQVMFTRSADGGQTWSNPIKLSESFSINEGTTIAIDPNTGAVHVIWRMIQNPSASQPNAILYAKSTDGGKTFTKASTIATINPFDQDDTYYAFRTRAFPTAAVDGNGVLYAAWAQRGVGPGGDARIVMTSTTDGRKWSTPTPIDNQPGRGHQFMPAMAFAGGKIMAIYYDARDDHTYGTYQILPGGLLSETRVATYDSCPAGSTSCDTKDKVFTPTISDAGLHRRHTIDVRVTQAPQPAAGVFPSFEASNKVSRYTIGRRTKDGPIEQLQFNAPNLPMFKLGTLPFLGDYIDLVPAVLFFKDSSGNWKFNTSPLNPTVFYAIWADNRDVRPPADGNWANYKVPTSAFANNYTANSLYDPTQPQPTCTNPGDLGQTGSRNQNIYSAAISQGLVVGSLGNTKPTTGIQRGLVIFTQNNTNDTRTVNLSVSSSAGVSASFLSDDSTRNSVLVDIPARSTIARTIWTPATTTSSVFTVSAKTTDDNLTPPANKPPLSSTTVLDPDPNNPTLINPDNLPDYLSTQNVQNLEVYNADISEAYINTRTLLNADIVNADIVNADIVNADIVNADIVNADIVNADIVNADIVNADIVNADIVNSSLTDATWTVTNVGNTATAYHLKLLSKSAQLPQGAKLQLIINKMAPSPIGLPDRCNLVTQVQNELLASIPEPTVQTDPTTLTVTGADVISQGIKNATVALAPKEIGRITLRMTGVDGATAQQYFQTIKVSTGNQKSPRPLALIITTLSLPSGTYNSAYSQPLQTVGGSGNFTWSLVSGSLPAGITLQGGTLSGTPTVAGDFTFSVRVDDPGSTSVTPPIPPEHDVQSLTLHIDRAVQTFAGISGVPASMAYGSSFTLSNTTTSAGLVITLSASGPCSVSGFTVTATGVGTCTLTASQGGSTIFLPITVTSAPITVVKADQTISFTSFPTLAAYGSTFTVSATATSGLAVGFTGVSGCAASGSTVTVTGTAGSACSVKASQPGDANWNAAPDVTQSAAIVPAAATLALANPTVTYNGSPQVAVFGTTPSGLSYSVTYPAPGTAPVNPGTYTIGATITDPNYAGSTTAQFTIQKASTATTITASQPNPSFVGLPITVAFAVAVLSPGAGTPTGTVTVTVAGSVVFCSAAVGAGSCSLTPTTTGAITLNATYSGDGNFFGSSGMATQTVTPPFNFTGFLGPLTAAGTYTSPTNSGAVNQGQAIPVKWQLKDQSGNYITDQSAASILTAEPNATCALAPGSAALSIPLSPSATGSTVLRYDLTNNQYVFNWDTSFQAKGCYNIVLKLADGTVKSTMVKIQ